MDQSEITERVEQFIKDQFLVTFGQEVSHETDLFEADIVDSFGFVELVTFLECTFGVALIEEDFASPEISNVAGIARLVGARLVDTRQEAVA